MKTFHALPIWALRAKVLAIAGISGLTIVGVLLVPSDLFLVVLATGIGFSAIAGYWLGARWFLVPLVAMAAEIVIAVPATLLDPTGGETPISVVLEAPFWTGLPALVGALFGGLIRLIAKEFQGKKRAQAAE
jgi:hypothetical protein